MTDSGIVAEVPRRRSLTPELRGYLFWGPVAVAITLTELLGVGWVQRKLGLTIPWPTISTTVGHLQERWNVVAALVVGIIAAIGFTSIAYRSDRTVNGRCLPDSDRRVQRIRFYGWELSILPAVVAGFLAAGVTDNKYAIGYAIYGTFALYGVIVPSLLVRFWQREVNFPTLLFTFEQLRDRYRWLTATFVALLAVLVFHLALYPWPSITNDPSRHAGLSAGAARDKANKAIKKLAGGRLEYSTQTRGVAAGKDAWLVFYSPVASSERDFSGCMVAVSATRVTPTPECSS